MKSTWIGIKGAGTALGTLILTGYGGWALFNSNEPDANESVTHALDPHSAKPSVYLAEGDGAAISRALLALPPEGGCIVLGGSEFLVRQPIVIDRDGIELRGTSLQTTLKLADDANCSVVIVGSVTTPIPRIVRGVSLRLLTIDGNRDGQAWECCGGPCDAGGLSVIRNNGITIRGAEDICVEHVVTRRARSGGVVLEKYCRRVFINNLESHDNHFDGLAAYEAENCTFTQLHLHHNQSAAMSFDWKFNRNLISDSTLEHNGSQGVFMRDAIENKFRNLTIHNNGQQGIFIAQTESLPGTACVKNTFTNLTVTGNQGHGMRINDASCIGNAVTRSRFTGNKLGNISQTSDDLLAVSEAPAAMPAAP
jgi:Right handed beta helix region